MHSNGIWLITDIGNFLNLQNLYSMGIFQQLLLLQYDIHGDI